MENILTDSGSAFIFGNDAVARGALESGVGFVTNYPGTPASEIGDTFAQIAGKTGIYFEYSTNEKVALEAAAGAAFSGVKSLVIMKHYGLNVALDSLLPLVYLECPLVVVVADDPGCFSSVQTEEDTRNLSRLAKIPTLEPADPQEAKDLTKLAFEMAENYQIPVLVRLTTRVSYSRSQVNFDQPLAKAKKTGRFAKNPQGFKLGSDQTVELHQKTLAKIEKIKQEVSEKTAVNFIKDGSGKLGIMTSGVSYNYLQEVQSDSAENFPILKIGMSYPFPNQMAADFIKNLNQILVIEELDPILETELKIVAKNHQRLRIFGKDLMPEIGEFGPEDIEIALAKILNQPISEVLSQNIANFKAAKIPIRIPFWCPGCPHRATFEAVKKALGKEVVFGGDIGCYMLGVYPPSQMLDYVVSMGAGVGIAHGISKSTNVKPVAFIGDSTFFHAGLPSLINLVFNKSDILVIILDNRCTAMTGHQPHPGTGFNASQKIKPILIEDLVKAAGADNVATINVYQTAEAVEIIKKLYRQSGVSVVVAKGECILFKNKQAKIQAAKKQDKEENDQKNA